MLQPGLILSSPLGKRGRHRPDYATSGGPSDRPLPAQFPSLAARVGQGDTDIDWQRKQVCREVGTQQPEGGVPRTWPGRA